MVLLLDGRYFIGILRSFDHFSTWNKAGRVIVPVLSTEPSCSASGNIVLEETRERKFGNGVYCDIPVGLYLLRGESIVMIGEFVS